jgi:hypothetical protein
MTDEEKKVLARKILKDDSGSEFRILFPGELRALYGEEHSSYTIPQTECCARDQARRILGEPEASECSMVSLRKRH